MCFPQKLSRSLQWVRQSALHCTTETMTIHNNQSSIKRIYMTLTCICVFLLFPLCFFSWRPIKNDSVTPYVFFHDDQLKNDSVTLYGFFMTTEKERVLSFTFHLIKTTVLPLMFFFMTTNKKHQCYPFCFFSWRPIKNNSVTPCVFFHNNQ